MSHSWDRWDQNWAQGGPGSSVARRQVVRWNLDGDFRVTSLLSLQVIVVSVTWKYQTLIQPTALLPLKPQNSLCQLMFSTMNAASVDDELLYLYALKLTAI